MLFSIIADKSRNAIYASVLGNISNLRHGILIADKRGCSRTQRGIPRERALIMVEKRLLECTDVSKSFGPTKAVVGVDFSLPRGEIRGLIGENGSGKSTLINSILNIVKADYDEVHILGQDLKSQEKEIKKEIAVIFNDSHYGENLTPLFIGKMLSGIYTDWDQKKFTDYLKQFHLPEKKRLKTFSTGMKVKLEFAAALSHNPKLLILDEATNGLDPVFREEILEILREFTEQEDHSVLISSHITSDLDKIADYIAYIHEGRLLFLKSIDELNNDCGIIRCGREFFDALSPEDIIAYREEPYSYCVFIKNRQSLRKAFCDISIENASIEDMMLFYSKGEKII